MATTVRKLRGYPTVMIDGHVIDAFLSEEHQFDSEVTDYPVESGSSKSDNIRLKPTMVTVSGIVSNTPLDDVQRDAGVLPSFDALVQLQLIRDLREPITIVTAVDVYENMVLQTLAVPRDRNTGEALRFSATFKQISIVVNERTVARVVVPIAKAKTNLGNVASPEEKAEENSEVSQAPRIITFNGQAATLDPQKYFKTGPGAKGIGRRLPIAAGGS